MGHFIRHALNINLQIPNHFSEKNSLRIWAAIFERKSLLFKLVFFLFFSKPLYQNVRIDHRTIFIFP